MKRPPFQLIKASSWSLAAKPTTRQPHMFYRAGEVDAEFDLQASQIAMLSKDRARMREAGCKLATAAMQVIGEYDGCHRLALAVAEWAQAVGDEGGRK